MFIEQIYESICLREMDHYKITGKRADELEIDLVYPDHRIKTLLNDLGAFLAYKGKFYSIMMKKEENNKYKILLVRETRRQSANSRFFIKSAIR